ncbi:hypothetical protein CYMTET_30466 [Cymbomonas tetramitiformis]|uniref:Uncharacterized protein n=1 Tax=Cymbomonas tetramitiformis TaxID=36881 RepID=A0AAE0FKB9_9CHLO|nr:hypothetical protein CYMTET_30466 [Cymbomonas tetramitiformis]
MDENGAWDLISRLMEKRPQDRFSANKALRHPWFSLEDASPSVVQAFLNSVDTVATGQGTDFQTWIVNTMAKNGSSEEVGGFTEGQLDEMGYKGSKAEEDEVVALPKFFERQLRRTIVRRATSRAVPRDSSALNFFKKFSK